MTLCNKTKAPRGWWCSLDLRHEGPCAAWPTKRFAKRMSMRHRWEALKIAFRGESESEEDLHLDMARAYDMLYEQSKTARRRKK